MDYQMGLDSYKKYKKKLKNVSNKFCSQFPKESKNVIKIIILLNWKSYRSFGEMLWNLRYMEVEVKRISTYDYEYISISQF